VRELLLFVLAGELVSRGISSYARRFLNDVAPGKISVLDDSINKGIKKIVRQKLSTSKI